MADRPTEGAPEDDFVQEMCDNARHVVELCDLLGFEFRGGGHLVALLRGAVRDRVSIQRLVDDPELRPYVWEEDD